MDSSKEAFFSHISSQSTPLSVKQIEMASLFAEILHKENELQNLTRILGVQNFYEGHLLDVIELFKLNDLGLTVLDLGSGCGVPGLLAAAIDENPSRKWILVDSEQSKADFLSRAAVELGLKNVTVYPGRVESVISKLKIDTVIARAVGNIEKIALWISGCSTWNNIILFKSTGWDKEWQECGTLRFGKKLTVTHTHKYSSGDKYRVLVTLKRK